MTKALLALMLATALAGIGIHLGSAPTFVARSQTAISGAAPTLTPGSFTHPLVFPPVDTNGNVSISIDEGCVQILDGPCTNMWTYGGTYPGLTVRRPTGQPTNVTFTNNLDATAGEMTVHNHGNHSTADNDGQPESLLIAT
jgi:spore coat protein A